MRAFGNPPVQVVLWNGQEITNHQGDTVARVLIRDRDALLQLVADPELHFGELYSAQRIEVQGNLLDFLEAVYRVWPLAGQSKMDMLLAPFNDARRNTLSGSRRNIHHHYDIGNDFYKLWLDERMLYTCAYFPAPDISLEDAQLAKLDHVCRKLRLRPGDKVVEAGCGWGALALHMARHYGVHGDSLQHIHRADRARPATRAVKKGWMDRSSSSRTITATCGASSMPSFPSACSNMSGQIITGNWARSSTAASRTAGAA